MFVGTTTSTKIVGIALVLTAIGILIFGVIQVTTNSFSIDRCNSIVAPYSVEVNKNGDEILFSWLEPWLNEECGASYLFQYRIDDQSAIEVTVTKPSYAVQAKLANCSTVYVNIWALSESGRLSENFVSQNYTEVPINAQVESIQFTSNDVGILMNWRKPQVLARCSVYYTINYGTELNTYSIITDTEYILIPHEQFCFQINATIGAWVDVKISSYTPINFNEATEIRDVAFSVAPQEPYELIVSWKGHPNSELCSVQYKVTYADDTKVLGAVETSKTQASFKAVYCVNAQIVLKYVSPFSHLGSSVLLVEAPNHPIKIGIVPGFLVTPRDESTLVSWTRIEDLAMCNVTYLVNLMTDLGNFTYEIADARKDFNGDLYCFVFDLKVRAIVGEVLGDPAGFTFAGYSLLEVGSLNLTKTETGNDWIASWVPNAKREQCDIDYYVTYWNGAVGGSVTVKESNVTFGAVPCDNVVNVTVKAISGERGGREASISYSCITTQPHF